jgi:glycosyltransferase involved in cell wall biosynthesis
VRVLYFSRDYTPHDHRFLTSLSESGNTVFSLRLERRGQQLEDRSLPPAIHQIPWQGGQQPFSWRDLPARLGAVKRLLREIQPDVLHAGPVQTVAFLAALSGFKPLVTMSWGSDLLKDAGRNWFYGWITRYTLSRSTVVIGDCQAVREKAAYFGFPAARTFIFPWGIDLQRFSPAASAGGVAASATADVTSTSTADTLASATANAPASATNDAPAFAAGSAQAFRARLGWQENFVVLSLRSWEPVYGVDVMLRGFARAAKEAAAHGAGELRLLMLGGGSQARLVHQIIQENGLQDLVYLGGQVNQASLPMMYRAADLYVSASHSDGSSVSLMEALGCGLLALVTDIPSNRAWITDGQQGWLFPDGDSQAVTAGMLRALHLAKQQPEKIAEMRHSSRQRACQRADWKTNFGVLLQAYQAARDLAGK